MNKIKLDPAVTRTINALKKAHAKSKAPGTFLALLENSGHYYVQTPQGAVKHRYVERDDTVTTYAGIKPTTVKMEKPCHA